MKTIIFHAKSSFVRGIVAACKAAAKFDKMFVPNNSGVALRFITSATKIAQLSNDLFWASYDVEEGRSISCEICIVPRETEFPSIRLKETVAFTREAIVALATASPNYAIAVGIDSAGRPVIWGFLDGIPFNRFLRYRIAGPGVIVAALGRRTIAVSEGEDAHELSPTRNYLNEIINLVVGAMPTEMTSDEKKRNAYAILNLAANIQQLGHGGALAVVPSDDDSWKCSANIKYENATKDQGLLTRYYEEVASITKAEEILGGMLDKPPLGQSILDFVKLMAAARQALPRQYSSTMARVGEFSSVDGAVLIDNQLHLLGFGCMFSSKDQKGFSVNEHDPLRGNEEPISKLFEELGGSRHRSAARFVYDNQKVVVFVASQDGGLKMFARFPGDDQVGCLKNVHHLIWDANYQVYRP